MRCFLLHAKCEQMPVTPSYEYHITNRSQTTNSNSASFYQHLTSTLPAPNLSTYLAQPAPSHAPSSLQLLLTPPQHRQPEQPSVSYEQWGSAGSHLTASLPLLAARTMASFTVTASLTPTAGDSAARHSGHSHLHCLIA